MTVEEPGSAVGVIKRITDQLGVHPEALQTRVERAEIDAETGPCRAIGTATASVMRGRA